MTALSGFSRGKRIAIVVGFVLAGLFALYWIVTGVVFRSFTVPTEAMANEILPGDEIMTTRFGIGVGTMPTRGLPIVFIYPGDRDEVEPFEEQYYLKRCVAVAGDTIEVRNHVVYVNGEEERAPRNRRIDPPPDWEESDFRTFPPGRGFTAPSWGPMRVPRRGDVIPLTSEEDAEAWHVFIEREGHVFRFLGDMVYVGFTIDGREVDSYTVERDYVFGMGDNRRNSEDSRYWGFIPVENITGTPVAITWSKEPGGPIRWGRIFSGIE